MKSRIPLIFLVLIVLDTVFIPAQHEKEVPLTPAETAQLKYFFRDFMQTLIVQGKVCRILDSLWVKDYQTKEERTFEFEEIVKYKGNRKLRVRALACVYLRPWSLDLLLDIGTSRWHERSMYDVMHEVLKSPGFKMGESYRFWREKELRESEDERILFDALRVLEPLLDEVERRIRSTFSRKDLENNVQEILRQAKYDGFRIDGRIYYQVRFEPHGNVLFLCRRNGHLKIYFFCAPQ